MTPASKRYVYSCFVLQIHLSFSRQWVLNLTAKKKKLSTMPFHEVDNDIVKTSRYNCMLVVGPKHYIYSLILYF
jgi:hypothetical protein